MQLFHIVSNLVIKCLFLLFVVLDKSCIVSLVPIRLNSGLKNTFVLCSDIPFEILFAVKSGCKTGLVESKVITCF